MTMASAVDANKEATIWGLVMVIMLDNLNGIWRQFTIRANEIKDYSVTKRNDGRASFFWRFS